MSGPPNPKTAAVLWNELNVQHDSFYNLDNAELIDIMYLLGALLTGGWTDLGAGKSGTAEILRNLPCFALLEPYLDGSRWYSDEDLRAIEVAHELSR